MCPTPNKRQEKKSLEIEKNFKENFTNFVINKKIKKDQEVRKLRLRPAPPPPPVSSALWPCHSSSTPKTASSKMLLTLRKATMTGLPACVLAPKRPNPCGWNSLPWTRWSWGQLGIIWPIWEEVGFRWEPALREWNSGRNFTLLSASDSKLVFRVRRPEPAPVLLAGAG